MKIGTQQIARTLRKEWLDQMSSESMSWAEATNNADAWLDSQLLSYPENKRCLIRDAFFDLDDEQRIGDTK